MIHTMLIVLGLMIAPPKSVHDFKFTTIDGKEISFSKFKGKKILIVNTASKCGYTTQYEDLEKLHKEYGKKVVVVGFPAGNFGGQELATNEEIQDFCKKNFGVSFLLSQKVSVKGDDMVPLFQYLTKQSNKDFTGDIAWNFEKFLVDEQGQLINRFKSKVKPMSEELIKKL